MKLVLHVPHSSRHIPAHERHSLLLSDDALQRELLHMTDAYTDELFSLPDAATVCYPVSRLVADPERFADDAEEVMTKVGMGVIYTKTCCGHPLRQPPSPEERNAILAQYYHPHHQTLTRAVNEALTSSGSCLVIDCHSFPHLPLPYELDHNPLRPDICIGTDDFHTPDELKNVLVSQFTGLSVLKKQRPRLRRGHWCQELGSIVLLIPKELPAKFLERGLVTLWLPRMRSHYCLH